MKTSSQLLDLFNSYLEQLPYDRRPASLYEPVKYVLSLGGKRIRPVLMLLGHQLYRDDTATILPVAAGIETYHNYTLLHDDLMDNADVRRGHPTVHRKWDANTAILSGDSMLVLAFHRMAECDPALRSDVMSLFTTTALEIGEGQQYDMEFERRDDVREEEYIEMIRLKTSVLLACAVKTGALLAHAPAREADALYAFGEQIGLAFQLQDDYLDVYGDEKVFGKAIGGDITSNKKTYMLINAFLRADDRQRAELTRWCSLREFDRQEKVAAVTRLYDEMGIGQLALHKIEEYFRRGLQCLDQVSVSEERKRPLLDYVNEMMHREK